METGCEEEDGSVTGGEVRGGEVGEAVAVLEDEAELGCGFFLGSGEVLDVGRWFFIGDDDGGNETGWRSFNCSFELFSGGRWEAWFPLTD